MIRITNPKNEPPGRSSGAGLKHYVDFLRMDYLREGVASGIDMVTMVHNGPTEVNRMEHYDDASHHLYNSLPMLSINRATRQFLPRTNGPQLELDKTRLFKYFNRLGPIKSVSMM